MPSALGPDEVGAGFQIRRSPFTTADACSVVTAATAAAAAAAAAANAGKAGKADKAGKAGNDRNRREYIDRRAGGHRNNNRPGMHDNRDARAAAMAWARAEMLKNREEWRQPPGAGIRAEVPYSSRIAFGETGTYLIGDCIGLREGAHKDDPLAWFIFLRLFPVLEEEEEREGGAGMARRGGP